MAHLTMKDLLQFGGLVEAQVLAGEAGLANPVESVSVLEVANPQIAQWVTKNELYITSFYAIREDIEMQKRVIETLARCTCCGLIICHIHQWVKKVDEAIIRRCNELGFPLIVAAGEVSYVEILNPIMGKLYKPELSTADYSSINSEFLDLIVDEDDLQVIYNKIAGALRLTMSLYDIYFNCLYSNKKDALVEEEKHYLQENMREASVITSQNHYIYVNSEGRLNILYLVKSRRNFFGYIILQMEEQGDIPRGLEIAESLSLTCSLIFNKKSKLNEVSDLQREEYLGNLLVWNFQSSEIAVRTGCSLGLDITAKTVLLVVNVNAFNDLRYESERQALAAYIKKWILPNVSDLVKQHGEANFAALRSDTLLLFLEKEGKAPTFDALCQKIITLFEKSGRSSVSIGVSNAMNLVTDIPEAYNQAFHSAIIGRQFYGVNRAIRFEDIFYIYQIKTMGNQRKNLAFCKKLLEPVMEYDKAKGTALMDTFEKLVLQSSDVNTLAEKLYIHRNTLLYRKNRIMELLGLNPFEMPYLFNYTIAFLILQQGN